MRGGGGGGLAAFEGRCPCAARTPLERARRLTRDGRRGPCVLPPASRLRTHAALQLDHLSDGADTPNLSALLCHRASRQGLYRDRCDDWACHQAQELCPRRLPQRPLDVLSGPVKRIRIFTPECCWGACWAGSTGIVRRHSLQRQQRIQPTSGIRRRQPAMLPVANPPCSRPR